MLFDFYICWVLHVVHLSLGHLHLLLCMLLLFHIFHRTLMLCFTHYCIYWHYCVNLHILSFNTIQCFHYLVGLSFPWICMSFSNNCFYFVPIFFVFFLVIFSRVVKVCFISLLFEINTFFDIIIPNFQTFSFWYFFFRPTASSADSFIICCMLCHYFSISSPVIRFWRCLSYIFKTLSCFLLDKFHQSSTEPSWSFSP